MRIGLSSRHLSTARTSPARLLVSIRHNQTRHAPCVRRRPDLDSVRVQMCAALSRAPIRTCHTGPDSDKRDDSAEAVVRGERALSPSSSNHVSLFERLQGELCGTVSEAPGGDERSVEWNHLLSMLGLADAQAADAVSSCNREAQHVLAHEDRVVDATNTLSQSESIRVLEYLLQVSLQRRQGEGLRQRTSCASAHPCRALYEAIRELRHRQAGRGSCEREDVLSTWSRPTSYARPTRARVPFASKGMYYSYAFALFVEAEKAMIALGTLLSDRNGGSGSTHSISCTSEQDKYLERVASLVDEGLEVLLLDAAADHHASATRPSSMLLALAGLYRCACLYALASDARSAPHKSVDGATALSLSFVRRAASTQAAARLDHQDQQKEALVSVHAETWREVSDFLMAAAAACVDRVVRSSAQTAPVQEVLWLWQQLADVCEKARATSDPSFARKIEARGCHASNESNVTHSTSSHPWMEMEAADHVARLGSPLLQRIHAVAATPLSDAYSTTARTPSVRLLWTALLTAPGVALQRRVDTSRRAYTVVSQEARGLSESILRVENNLLGSVLSSSTEPVQVVTEKEGGQDGLSLLLVQLEEGNVAREEKASQTRQRRARVLEALVAPFSACMRLSLHNAQDRERLALLDVDAQTTREIRRTSDDAEGDIVNVDIQTSLLALLMKKRLVALAAQQQPYHQDDAECDQSCLASENLLAQLSRFLLHISAFKRELRANNPHNNGDSLTKASRRQRTRSPRLLDKRALKHISFTEQLLWLDVLSAVRDGPLVPFPQGDRVSSTLRIEKSDAVLTKFVLPLYDHRQWRAPTVNVFVAVLDQWKLRTQMRDVFRVIFQREASAREAILSLIRDQARDRTRRADDDGESAYSLPEAPVLSMTSCQAVLTACCADDAFARPLTETAVYPFMAAQVVEYALLQLHWWSLYRQQDAREEEEATLDGCSVQTWRAWVEGEARTRVRRAFDQTGETLPDEWRQRTP